jgi:hypothetical protein
MVIPPPADVPAAAAAPEAPWLTLPAHWPGQADLLGWCEAMGPGLAALLILAGVVYLMFGWCLFKVLVMINAGLLGGMLGALIGQQADAAVIGVVLAGFTLAAVAWPLMKHAVAIMGAGMGGVVGAAIWCLGGLEPGMAWAGAMTGVATLGLLTFVLFRGSVIMFMSLQGSVMLIFGLLGLVYKYPEVAPMLTRSLSGHPAVLPAAIFIPMLIGLVYQQTQYPAAEKKASAGPAAK